MGKQLKRFFKGTDLIYLLLCMICCAYSVVVLYSWCRWQGDGDYHVAIVQAAAAGLGLVLACILSALDYHTVAQLWPIHAALSWGLVLLTFKIGYSPLDTTNKAWIKLPMGMSLQPSELAKISFIITFALHLSAVREDINRPYRLLPLLVHLLVPAVIIHLQGDDGTMLVFLIVGLCMLFSAGLSFKYILPAVIAAAAATPLLWSHLAPYQQERITALLHQDDPQYAAVLYQQLCGKVSIGAGQITGRGLFGEHHYVPLAYNDFIFSYLSECLGFVGSLAVLVLLGAVCVRTIRTGLRSGDELGTFICVGVFGVFLAQILINLGMNLLLLPVIGVTLPFFSSGGTSVTMLFLCVGMVMSVYRFRPTDLFAEKYR